MKQIVDKLNKIAKKINENVELSDRDLIIDSLDSITKAYGGTPNDSTLIVDKLDDIYNNISPAVSGNIEITENGENINVAPYATATVNVSGGGDISLKYMTFNLVNNYDEPVALPQGTFTLLGCVPIIDGKLISTFSIDNEMYKFDLSTIINEMPSGTTTLILPYIFYDVLDFVAVAFGSIQTVDKVTYSNMTYDSDNNGVSVTDITENSVITYTPTK